MPEALPARASAAPAPPAAGRRLEADVAVVGGGPAGSTAATLLARRGWRVVLLEKEAHPRFHIGESLLPMNLPILERLGVLAQVRAIGTRKHGADFPRDDGSYSVFEFRRALGARVDHAFQVPRAEFDRVLFENARAAGVDARERTRALAVDLDGAGGPLLQAQDPQGPLAIRARMLVDASGRDTFLGGRLGLRRRDRRHGSAAVFGHYRGVEPRPGAHAGNISIVRHRHGWIWLIPLPGGVTSVGAVCAPEHLQARRGDSEAFLLRTLQSAPEARRRMRGAEAVAPVQATGNYSYECARMHGPGWLLLGDAWTFIDPMFSSGVYLAMHGAERAAAAVDTALRDPARGPAAMRALERQLRPGLDEFRWFIHRFASPAMKRLFAHPRNLLGVEQAVIAMLAGDVFDNRAVRWRLRLFRVLYALARLDLAARALAARRRRPGRRALPGATLDGAPREPVA